MASDLIVTLTKDNFDDKALKSTTPILVDFWAEWCGPCKQIGPLLEELAKEYTGKVAIGKVNVDEEPDLAQKYGVRSIPTLLIVKKGEVVDQWVGAKGKGEFKARFDRALA
jgi:thioredoxin 1